MRSKNDFDGTYSKRLEMIEKGLSGLEVRHAYIGGTVAPLYVSQPRPNEVRQTADVDCVFEVMTLIDFYDLQEKLRSKGFRDDLKDQQSTICRLVFNGVKVDILPVDPSVLGFKKSVWYQEAFDHLESRRLPSGTRIQIFSLPYYLANKLEVFRDRGGSDYRYSQDLEDICFVVEGFDGDIVKVIQKAPSTVQRYLSTECKRLSADPLFRDALAAFFPGGSDAKSRINRLQKLIETVGALKPTNSAQMQESKIE